MSSQIVSETNKIRMKMKTLAVLLSIFLFSGATTTSNTSSVSAQKKEDKKSKKEILVEEGKVGVDKVEHDFGTIAEDGGKVSTIFTLHNKTEKPILINHVRASCGCTTPSWTKEPIDPGKTGEIIVNYDPTNRRAPFNKSITIITNGEPERIVVRIKGTVE